MVLLRITLLISGLACCGLAFRQSIDVASLTTELVEIGNARHGSVENAVHNMSIEANVRETSNAHVHGLSKRKSETTLPPCKGRPVPDCCHWKTKEEKEDCCDKTGEREFYVPSHHNQQSSLEKLRSKPAQNKQCGGNFCKSPKTPCEPVIVESSDDKFADGTHGLK